MAGASIDSHTPWSNGQQPKPASASTDRSTGHVDNQDDGNGHIEAVNDQVEPTTTPATEASTPLLEAASSVNFYLTINGYKVQLTLRDMDETRLLKRLEAITRLFPPAPPDAPPATAALATPELVAPAAPEGWCRLHEVQMRQWPGKDGRKAWWSHRLEDGTWCKGR